jgi:hypothetical protein
LKLGPARQVDPGLEPGRVEKTGEEKIRHDPVDPARPGYKPVAFCFFFVFFLLKRRRFDLKKKLTQPIQ